MNKSKKYTLFVLISSLFILLGIIFLVVLIDPYFQYHHPLAGVDYKINDQRYQNHGIVKNFSYDSIIMGTSMSENFRTSEAEELFGGEWIKVCLSGASTRERLDMLEVALESDNEITTIINSLDTDSKYWLVAPENILQVGEFEYPTYLYNKYLHDDVNYWFNKNVLFEEVLSKIYRYDGVGNITAFDDYSRWAESKSYGEDRVKENYIFRTSDTEKIEEQAIFGDAQREMVENVLEQNFREILEDNADVQFVYFIPPYSIAQRKLDKYEGYLNRRIEVEKQVIKYLIEFDNVSVYSWNLDFELINDLSVYRDVNHYNGDISTDILKWIHGGHGLITKENYTQYIKEMEEYFLSYDYDSLLE